MWRDEKKKSRDGHRKESCRSTIKDEGHEESHDMNDVT